MKKHYREFIDFLFARVEPEYANELKALVKRYKLSKNSNIHPQSWLDFKGEVIKLIQPRYAQAVVSAIDWQWSISLGI